MLLQQRQHLVLQAVALVELESCFEVQLAQLSRQLQPMRLGGTARRETVCEKRMTQTASTAVQTKCASTWPTQDMGCASLLASCRQLREPLARLQPAGQTDGHVRAAQHHWLAGQHSQGSLQQLGSQGLRPPSSDGLQVVYTRTVAGACMGDV